MSVRDPDGVRLPVRIDSTSNGEFEPVPLNMHSQKANALAFEQATDNARKLNLDRRAFMISTCGAATTLAAFNTANAHEGLTGGRYILDHEAGLDEAAAADTLDGDEFIFDVQGHYVNPTGAWIQDMPEEARPFSGIPNPCVVDAGRDTRDYLECLNADTFIKDIFLDSDTQMMVLSFVPSARDAEPLTIEEAEQTRRIVDAMEGGQRLFLHGRVNPNQAGDVEDMERLATEFPIAAWKTYTQWGPDGQGFSLTDEAGERFIEEARRLGVNNIAIHKGLPFGPQSYEHSRCDDVGAAAARHPDINFIIYHSGFDTQVEEAEFVEGCGKAGIDSLVQSLMDHEITTNSNVYAELGSTWRFLMRDPDMAAHSLGKLIKACGEDNVLWGTDSIWYGSPQDQIQAFRAFQISEEFQERFGYPELTPAIKARIFGLNAMKPYKVTDDDRMKAIQGDRISRIKATYSQAPDPSFQTYGPRNRREFLTFKSRHGDGPS